MGKGEISLDPLARCEYQRCREGPTLEALPTASRTVTNNLRLGFRLDGAMMSNGVQHALKDMIELQMYLVAQSHGKPWPLLPRSTKPRSRGPYCNAVDLGVADELVDRGFIEKTSSQTFVVSKSGCEFYLREIKPHSDGVSPPHDGLLTPHRESSC